jgi:hypothetical protein
MSVTPTSGKSNEAARILYAAWQASAWPWLDRRGDGRHSNENAAPELGHRKAGADMGAILGTFERIGKCSVFRLQGTEISGSPHDLLIN